MQTKKMSLANIQGKLSRAEMKNIMAGSDSGGMSCDGPAGQAFCRAMNPCYSCSNTSGYGVGQCYFDYSRCNYT